MNISLRTLFVCALIVASCMLLVDGRRHHGRPRRHHRDHTPSPPSPSPSATCTPKPYDFGSYDYCGANFFTSDSYTIPQGLKLKSVQLMTRHGDRTPVSILPHYDVDYPFCDATASVGFYSMGNGQKRPIRRTMGGHDEGRRLEMNPLMQPASLANPYAGRIWQGNCMNGQLTSRGIEQLMEIGSNLRDIYVGKLGYLPSTYTRDNTSFYLRITDVWRTRQSAESLLTGLWPSSGLEDDVIPFQSFPAEIETMYANTKACEALAKVQASQTSSDEWKQHLNVPDVWSQLDSTMGTGHLPDWHQGFDHQFDNLQTRKCHKLPLPCQTGNSSNCLSPDVAEFVFGQGDWEYQFMMLNSPLAPKLAQLGIGAFMSVIRDVIVAKVSNDPSKSSIGTPDFAYYSGHDTTLAAVLGALNVTGFRWPPYASQMIFELWSDESASNGYFVRVLYNGAVLPMYAAGCCEELCPVNQFISYLNTMIPNNLVDLCTPSSVGQ